MRYAGMPLGMWALFVGSFKKQLSVVYGYNSKTAKVIIDKAKPKYKRIIEGLPPYSWNMEYLSYPDGSGYEARFTSCGICTLMRELGLFELVPAMCRLDYNMSEASGVSEFVREYTLASGGPYCDCGYKKLKG